MSTDVNVTELYPQDLDKDFDSHLAELGFGVNPGGMRRMYRREALRLNTLSDFDLSLIGLVRSDIPAFVMRHRFPTFAERFSYLTVNS